MASHIANLPSAPIQGGREPRPGYALYCSVCARGRRGQFWSMLQGRSPGLHALEDVSTTCSVTSQNDGGIRPVPIGQIRGSEGRSLDFDRDFSPLQERTRERWLGIFAARRAGKELPPVSLVQVGDLYFVRDGHHRISVAQALGQTAVEARVTIWQVDGPLPWEVATHPTALERIVSEVRQQSTRFGAHVVLNLQSLLNGVGKMLRVREGERIEETAALGPVSM